MSYPRWLQASTTLTPIPTAGVLVLMAGAVAFVTVAVKKRPDRIQTSANGGDTAGDDKLPGHCASVPEAAYGAI